MPPCWMACVSTRPMAARSAIVHLPERCANVCFGGPKGNRLFMAATRSVYALHVNTVGAEFA